MHNNEIKSALRQSFHFVLNCLPILFWCLLIFSFDTPLVGIMTIISALIHELGHEIFIYSRTGQLRTLRGVINGFKLSCNETARFSYIEEAMLYASGPLANIAVAALFPFYSALGSYSIYFAVINLTTAASNLLPIRGYDGHGILRTLLNSRISFDTAERISAITSSIFTVSLCITSLYFIDRFGEGYWIFFVFSLSLISSITQSLKNANWEK